MTRTGAGTEWSNWAAAPGGARLTPGVLAEILDGGQAFRWRRFDPESWVGVWAENVARLRLDRDGALQWSAPVTLAPRVALAVAAYVGDANDFATATDRLPWRSDPHLAACVATFPGLRILRQPFAETLLCFLCSATKQIVQIKQMVRLLAERHGEFICRTAASDSAGGETKSAMPSTRRSDGNGSVPSTTAERGGAGPFSFHALPTWDKLATIPEADLRACLLGFRARYIAETARFLAAHPSWLAKTEALPYAEAKTRLCSLPGVGEKVADCVLLFGAGRLEAFPVDVWILKTMATRYGLHGWKPAQLTQFGRVHFGVSAGLAQQFLFAWERRAGRTPAPQTVPRAT